MVTLLTWLVIRWNYTCEVEVYNTFLRLEIIIINKH